ncbi:MAG: hypothetical protein JST01_27365, partial [Cyanobacteria bacterium SZAS TMP-1]|nr:hypothetical protein [Cyanobacteria bacterium SZAS TMP-1]
MNVGPLSRLLNSKMCRRNAVWTISFACAATSTLGLSSLCPQPAAAILPPRAPNLAPRSESRASLFLQPAEGKERMDAHVQINNLSVKISHLADATIIASGLDTSKLSAEGRDAIVAKLSQAKSHLMASLLTRRGTLLAVVGDTERAIADLDEAVHSDALYAPAYNNRACLRASSGDFDGALADASKAISIVPNFAEAFDTRGSVYFATKRYTLAQADFN